MFQHLFLLLIPNGKVQILNYPGVLTHILHYIVPFAFSWYYLIKCSMNYRYVIEECKSHPTYFSVNEHLQYILVKKFTQAYSHYPCM